jgi:hypothetical protein
MKLRSADVETLWDGLKYSYQTGGLSQWRFRAARFVYLTALSLLRRSADA